MISFKNKTVLVTGGTRGIGLAAVRDFLNLGAKVIAVGHSQESVSQAEVEFGNMSSVTVIRADVSTSPGRGKLVAEIDKIGGSLHVLVNNAGINIRKSTMEYSEYEWRKVFETNLTSAFELSRGLYPFLKASGKGSIVNVASIAGTQDVRTGSPYAMSKAAMLQLTRDLAVEWAPDGIRVNSVSPWFTETPLTDSYLKVEEKRNAILARTPLNRIGKADEIAAAITFLASDRASYITGQNLQVDGGMSACGI